MEIDHRNIFKISNIHENKFNRKKCTFRVIGNWTRWYVNISIPAVFNQIHLVECNFCEDIREKHPEQLLYVGSDKNSTIGFIQHSNGREICTNSRDRDVQDDSHREKGTDSKYLPLI